MMSGQRYVYGKSPYLGCRLDGNLGLLLLTLTPATQLQRGYKDKGYLMYSYALDSYQAPHRNLQHQHGPSSPEGCTDHFIHACFSAGSELLEKSPIIG